MVSPEENNQAFLTGGWDDISRTVVSFSSEQLQDATQNYNDRMVLGKGSFGVVYKGTSNRFSYCYQEGKLTRKVFILRQRTFELLGLHHANLVNLVGYCMEERTLVFEFMENGSLYDCLFEKHDGKLGLFRRVKIALQAVRGLDYLHEYAISTIIHRDVKSSNSLLECSRVGRVELSLFGPAANESHVSNTTVAGTLGYLDTEYYQTLQLTSKSDVYSFGVVLMELVTGRKAISEQEALVPWVTETMGRESYAPDILIDKSLERLFEQG